MRSKDNPLKKISGGLFAALGLLSISTAHAQIITWGAAQNMSGFADVANNGAYADAASFYSSVLSINGVTFNPLTGSQPTYTDSLSLISVEAPSGTVSASSFTSAPPSSTDYSNLVSAVGYATGTSGEVTLSGLTNGDNYQVQVWASYIGAPGQDATTYSGPAGSNTVTLTPELNQYAIGTFTASGSSESFCYSPSRGSYSGLNAISVRDTTTVVPEPSAWALMLGGLGLLALWRLRTRRFLI
jgi:hypothetical protein